MSWHNPKHAQHSDARLQLGLGGGGEVVGRHHTIPDSPVAVRLNAKVVGAAHNAEPALLAPLKAGRHELDRLPRE